MNEDRDRSDLNVYGAEDFEELDAFLAALDGALDTDGQPTSSEQGALRRRSRRVRRYESDAPQRPIQQVGQGDRSIH